MKQSFLIFGAELPWVFPLADELAAFGPTLGLRVGVSPPAGTAWPFEPKHADFIAERWTYPRGFNGTFAPWFNGRIRSRVNKALKVLQEKSGTRPHVVVPDPSLLAYVADVETDRLVYLNYDDYTVETSHGPAEMPGETELATQAGTLTCSSHVQAMRFRERFSAKPESVFHLPHGVHDSFVNRNLSEAAEPNTVCCVGYLTARYDWFLIHEVVSSMTDVTFSFIGEGPSERANGEGWRKALGATLAMPNVRHVAGLRHLQTAPHYWRNAVNWMPYDTALPFVQACCPLKLTDGLASGRPIVSADVPECALYPEWIDIYRGASEAEHALRRALEPSPGRASAQVAFALENTWADRARSLATIIGRNACTY